MVTGTLVGGRLEVGMDVVVELRTYRRASAASKPTLKRWKRAYPIPDWLSISRACRKLNCPGVCIYACPIDVPISP